MYPVADIVCNLDNKYSDNRWIRRVKDRLSTNITGESFIKDLQIRISHITLPPNVDKVAYKRNIYYAAKKISKSNVYIAPRTLRIYDYKLYNNFQRQLMAYGIATSIQLILRMKNKNIKNSCIVFYDAADEINERVIYEVAKHCSYIVLVTENIQRLRRVSDYILSEYGVSPIITLDHNFAFKSADFVITSRKIEIQREAFIWYIDNDFIPKVESAIPVNDVVYNVPWKGVDSNMAPELLGAILSQISNKDVESTLSYNGIYIESINFNKKGIIL